MFCLQCGKELPIDAKFCIECGSKVEIKEKLKGYDNDIKKCNNCATFLNYKATKCFNCGYSFDEIIEQNENIEVAIKEETTKSTIKEFMATLETFEKNTLEEKNLDTNKKSKLSNKNKVSSKKQKIDFIKNFPISNEKQEIIDFIILAGGNIDANQYNSYSNNYSLAKLDLSIAWFSKLEQAYQKARLYIKNEEEFVKIKQFYDGIKKEIEKSKKKQLITTIAIIVGCISMILMMLLIGIFSS